MTDYRHMAEVTGRPIIASELDKTITMYTDMGFQLPPEATISMMMTGIGHAFIPEESAPPHLMQNTSQATAAYFDNVVQPRLRESDPASLALAGQVGRLIGATYVADEIMKFNPPFNVSDGKVNGGGIEAAFPNKTGIVIEYGMGINGLATHIQNLKQKRYRVLGVHRSAGEAALLRGMAGVNGIDGNQLNVVADGIPESMQRFPAGRADLIIASRVHAAGQDLRIGIEQAGRALTSGGVFIGNGPRKYSKGFSYDSLATLLASDARFKIEADRRYAKHNKVRRGIEDNRLIVARKR